MIPILKNDFPIDFISLIAEHESWRKEVYRPVSYIHKWWAKRLGSVFRSILISSISDSNIPLENNFHNPIDMSGYRVFDPFMGSGTTVYEAIKLGCNVIGRDINPIPYIMVRAGLSNYDLKKINSTFQTIEEKVKHLIMHYYSGFDLLNEPADVLYFFWVKQVACPQCSNMLDLFPSRIFSSHAYPKKYPMSKASCPKCDAVCTVDYSSHKATCEKCETQFDPHLGNVKRSSVKCHFCDYQFKVIDAVRNQNTPPLHRMYAKMILNASGEKEYLPITSHDLSIYNEAAKNVEKYWDIIPNESIENGYNTKQVLNYNYTKWHQMFNARQLVCLSLIAKQIENIQDENINVLFSCLFSGILEFNNMFASFKGEGTGAVRHMFYHHVLKPELMPLEANIWGTPKSSGSFSTLFNSRIIRALEYKDDPFELRLKKDKSGNSSDKIYSINHPLNAKLVDSFKDFTSKNGTYISLGDSSCTDIEDKTIDLVLTDPPFFDNVHYSELADFFFVWIKKTIKNPMFQKLSTTRMLNEVQDSNSESFSKKLKDVFSECYRVLKDNGLLIFTYHHSRIDGWISVYRAIREAGFHINQTHPVKAEMSVSVPVLQSKSPISFDLIICCEKKSSTNKQVADLDSLVDTIMLESQDKMNFLNSKEIKTSEGDLKVAFMGALMRELSKMNNIEEEISLLINMESNGSVK